jgi:hypothetical protein
MRRLKWVALMGVMTTLAASSQASGATPLGEAFLPTDDFGGDGIFVQTVSPNGNYDVPSNGVITSWTYHATAGPTPPMKLKMMRHAGGLDYTVIGESALETPAPDTVNTWPTRISVKAGDLLGIYYSATTFSFRPAAGYEAVFIAGTSDSGESDQSVGSTRTYEPDAGNQIDVAAKLEPDADGDGYGDETQDQCPSKATKQSECNPPQTTITKGVKQSKTGDVRFRFKSDESGSSFKCKLKGNDVKRRLKQFKRCDSPRKYKNLDPGKYRFKVRATDAAGNADPTPAKDKFRVVDPEPPKDRGGSGGGDDGGGSDGGGGGGGGGCDPNYSGACVPPYPPDVDCADVGTSVTVTGSDPHGLDGDNDGVGCE